VTLGILDRGLTTRRHRGESVLAESTREGRNGVTPEPKEAKVTDTTGEGYP